MLVESNNDAPYKHDEKFILTVIHACLRRKPIPVGTGWEASLLLSSRELMNKGLLLEYYRCPQEYLDFCVSAPLQGSSGYFHFGPALTCYGQTSGYTCPTVNDHLFDASAHVSRHGHTSFLPFDPSQVLDNLRYERYVDHSS